MNSITLYIYVNKKEPIKITEQSNDFQESLYKIQEVLKEAE